MLAFLIVSLPGGNQGERKTITWRVNILCGSDFVQAWRRWSRPDFQWPLVGKGQNRSSAG